MIATRSAAARPLLEAQPPAVRPVEPGYTAAGGQRRARRRRLAVARPAALISATGLLALCIGLGYVGLKAEALSLTYRLSSVEERLHELELENAALSLTVQEKGSLARIERIARQKLGMVRPASVRFIAPAEGERRAAAGARPDGDATGLFAGARAALGGLWRWFAARTLALR